MKTLSRGVYLLLFLSAAIQISGCATQSVNQEVVNPPGFLLGIVHGFIILFSFIWGLFTEYTIYAFPNAGGWYDFGFLLGVMIFFGGGGAGARR